MGGQKPTLEAGQALGDLTLVRSWGEQEDAQGWAAMRAGEPDAEVPVWVGAARSRTTALGFDVLLRWAERLTHENVAVPLERLDAGPWTALVWPPLTGARLAELGEELSRVYDKDPARWRLVVVHIVRSILAGLAHVHSQQEASGTELAHTALRPDLIWVQADGGVKVAAVGAPRTARVEGADISAVPSFFRYRAPDHAANRRGSPLGDIWTVGAIFHELLSGVPFRGHHTESSALGKAVVSGEVPPIAREVPADLARVCESFLAADRTKRVPSAAAGVELLAQCIGDADGKKHLAALVAALRGKSALGSAGPATCAQGPMPHFDAQRVEVAPPSAAGFPAPLATVPEGTLLLDDAVLANLRARSAALPSQVGTAPPQPGASRPPSVAPASLQGTPVDRSMPPPGLVSPPASLQGTPVDGSMPPPGLVSPPASLQGPPVDRSMPPPGLVSPPTSLQGPPVDRSPGLVSPPASLQGPPVDPAMPPPSGHRGAPDGGSTPPRPQASAPPPSAGPRSAGPPPRPAGRFVAPGYHSRSPEPRAAQSLGARLPRREPPRASPSRREAGPEPWVPDADDGEIDHRLRRRRIIGLALGAVALAVGTGIVVGRLIATKVPARAEQGAGSVAGAVEESDP